MSEKSLRSIFKLLIVVATAALLAYNYSADNSTNSTSNETANYVSDATRIHFVDVGQGDCTLIESNGEFMLIDGGEADSKDAVLEYIDSLNISKLKYVIATHPHSDHIGSLQYVLNTYKTENVIMPKVSANTTVFKKFAEAIQNNNINVIEPQIGNNYNFGDCSFTIIAPYEYDNENMNNNSVGIKLIHKNDKCIFMGDNESDVEKQLLDNGVDIDADLFKASHHGSKTSNSFEFVKAVSPTYAVISCGKDNEYSHPHDVTLETFEKLNVDVYRTDESGSIVFESTGDGLKVVKGAKSGASLSSAA